MAGSPSRQDIDVLVGLVSQHHHAEAEALARRLIAGFPQHGFAWKALGAALKSQGRMTEAVAAQQHAIALLPGDAGAHYNLGNSLLALGRLVDAAGSYGRAVAIKPDYVEAHFNLGNALAAHGRLNDAVASYRGALAIKPDFIEAHAKLGYTLMAADLVEEAEPHFLQALAARPGNAQVHNSLGIVYRRQGRIADAETCYRRAMAITPDYAEAHSNLGNVLGEQGRNDEAEASYRQALAINDRMAEAHFNLGNILRQQDRQPEAERSYRRALEIQPEYLMALTNLGLCLKRQGRLDEASQCFQAAIAIKPDFLQAHCNLAPLKTYAVDDADLGLFEDQQHQLSALPVTGRVSYWFALGKMREDVARYDDAFAAYEAGNHLQRTQFPHDEAREVALVQRLQSVFSAAFFADRSKPVHAGKVPIFIVGMPRSGTSLIEQILSTHPGVHGAGELTELGDVVHSITSSTGDRAISYPEIATTLSADEFRRLGEAYIERVWRLAPEAERITDKLPANFQHLGMIHLMLPQARIIHAMRDPMDSCFSCYSRLFEGGNLDFAYDLGSVGRYYARYIELMQHWHRVLPAGTVLDMRYEDMVTDTEGQARRLLEYLGLPWHEGCLAFHRNKRAVRTASAAQVRRPIYRSSVARWQHFEAHLAPLLDIVQRYR
ncbi:tetratricopeptide repeat-containing sulfotransferase family protein [Rhodanobacter sp. C05]|uniref:tetratricopeptide repeat-containing sulfotransferase family protein n=1 Tax=Rhodanobacter sp. C05 TaxID=1945855 RepID=UPI001438C471|nr:tetratricopeptide repeat-containing sulfotransferase family protein [Rhodanobacter sp. C05]